MGVEERLHGRVGHRGTEFTITYSEQVRGRTWKAGTNPQVQVRFREHRREERSRRPQSGQQWALTANNMITPSNIVDNLPPVHNPSRRISQSKEQGDPTVSIDRKTMLLGDTGATYLVTLGLKQTNNAYRVWKASITAISMTSTSPSTNPRSRCSASPART